MTPLRVLPTRRAVFVAGAFLLVATLPPRGSRLLDLLLAAIAALVPVALVLAVLALRRLRVERETPSTGTRGERVPVVTELVNDSGSAAWSVVVEEWGLGPGGPVAFFPSVPAASRASARGRLRLAERGRLALTGARLASSDPFGLFRATRVDRVAGEILVYPRPRRLAARRIIEAARRGHAASARKARARESTEPAFVREYRHGDSPRSVHWRLSAHRGSLVVKTFTDERPHDALIVLDRVPPDFGPKGLAAFERAVALAAGLGLEVLDRGGEVTLVATGEPPLHLERLRARGGRAALLEALALVEPGRDGAAELPPLGERDQDAFVVTARGARPGALPVKAPGRARVVLVEGGPGPASSDEGGAP